MTGKGNEREADDMISLLDRVYGSLLGGLIGDAMGAPVEGWNYTAIEEKHGIVDTFEGNGTDDSAVKLIICRALLKNRGHITADELAESFLDNRQYYDLFFIPVRNMLHKLIEGLCLPVDAGYGNMQSSSSAMAISPMGLVNACNPRQAAMETYEVAGLVHSGPAAFCRDGACAMAAAVAQAMVPGTTVDEIIEASTQYLHPQSSAVMIGRINEVMALARNANDYKVFREVFYAGHICDVICDSRETIPATLAIFYLSGGDPVKCIINAANFGRDTDTNASMIGAIAGAYAGVNSLSKEWVAKIEAGGDEQMRMAQQLTELIRARTRESKHITEMIAAM